MKSFADLLYELADFLHEEGRRLESGYGLNGLNETYRTKADEIRQALRTPNGDVLTPEQIAAITKKYDRTGTFFADIYALADSHEAMRRALDTNASICERLMSWEPNTDQGIWYRSSLPGIAVNVQAEPMTADEISWFETYRNKQADARGQMIDIDHHEQDATEVDDNIHITGRED